ncbi:MAG: FkbM family methyltransferase [Halohasta sp.]
MTAAATWLFRRLRWVGYRSYYRLVGANYDRRWLAPRKSTPAGAFRSYDLLNRHGGDAMLAEMHGACGSAAVIYDIGANVGVYSLALAAGSPERRLLAFEPAPRIRAQLRANVDCNDFGDRIEIIDCGVGDEDATRTFYRSTYPELSGFDRESATRWEASLAGTVEVPVRRVDTLVESHPVPDAIKVDVEGAGPAVLRGARETLGSHEPTLFIEVHEEELSRETGREVRAVLEDVGYTADERDDYWRCEPGE